MDVVDGGHTYLHYYGKPQHYAGGEGISVRTLHWWSPRNSVKEEEPFNLITQTPSGRKDQPGRLVHFFCL